MKKSFMVLTGVGMALILSSTPASACGCSHPDGAMAPAQPAVVAPVAAASEPVNATAYVTPEPVRRRVVIAAYNPTGYHSRVRR